MIDQLPLSDATRERLETLCGNDEEKSSVLFRATLDMVVALGGDLAENLLLTELEIVRDLKLNLRGVGGLH